MVFFLAFLEMIARMVAEARRLGYSESSIWTNIQPGLRAFAIYYGKKGISFYDPEITNEYVGLQKERLSRKEISDYAPAQHLLPHDLYRPSSLSKSIRPPASICHCCFEPVAWRKERPQFPSALLTDIHGAQGSGSNGLLLWKASTYGKRLNPKRFKYRFFLLIYLS